MRLVAITLSRWANQDYSRRPQGADDRESRELLAATAIIPSLASLNDGRLSPVRRSPRCCALISLLITLALRRWGARRPFLLEIHPSRGYCICFRRLVIFGITSRLPPLLVAADSPSPSFSPQVRHAWMYRAPSPLLVLVTPVFAVVDTGPPPLRLIRPPKPRNPATMICPALLPLSITTQTTRTG